MPSNDAEEIANGVDPDQTAPLDLHCLPRPICPKTYGLVPMDDFKPHQTEDDKNVIVFGL